MSKSSQSPQANRGSSQDHEQFSKGSVDIGIRAFRKDGGPENAGIKDPDGGGIESINSRAHKPHSK